MKKLPQIILLAVLFSVTAIADIRLPETPTPKPTATPKVVEGKQVDMLITLSSNFTEPTLVISKGSLKDLRAALDEAEGIGNTAGLNTENSESSHAPAIGSTQTVVGGIFLSLAFVFGGVWFAKGKPSKTAIVLFLVATVGGSTALVLGNAAPPRLFSISKSMFANEFQQYAYARGKVRVKIIDAEGSSITLNVPRGDVSKKPNEE